MKKIILFSVILSALYVSCKKDTATTPVATFTYGDWSDCSSASVQTRTFTSSVAGANPPADSISRSCIYVSPTVIFNYGAWTGDCLTDGVQRRDVVSTIPADSLDIANPPLDSIIRICPATAASFPGIYKITADTLYTKLAGQTTYSLKEDIYSDTLWNPSASKNDLYNFVSGGSFTYDDGGTPVPRIILDSSSFLSYPYSWGETGSTYTFATNWLLKSGFLYYTFSSGNAPWGYFEKIIPSEFVLNYSFTSSTTGNKYIQSTTYTRQ